MRPELADMNSVMQELKSDAVILHSMDTLIWVGNGSPSWSPSIRWIMQITFCQITDLFRIYDYASGTTSRYLTFTQVLFHLAYQDLLKDPWVHGTRILDGKLS